MLIASIEHPTHSRYDGTILTDVKIKTILIDVRVIHLTEKRYLVTYDYQVRGDKKMDFVDTKYKEELNRLNNRIQEVSGVKLSQLTGWSIRKAQRVKENFAIGYLSNWESRNICYKGKWHKFFKEISFREYMELKEAFNLI